MSLTLFHPEFMFNEMDLLRPLALPRMAADRRELLVDVIESDSDFRLKADLPGVKKEDVHVNAKNGVVTISVDSKTEKDEEKTEDGMTWHTHERSHNFVSRSIRMPKTADLKKAKASMHEGVLSLTVPKLAIEDAKDDGERIAVN